MQAHLHNEEFAGCADGCGPSQVNTGPSLGATAPIDRKVKYPVVADMLNLVGLVPYDRLAYEREEEERRQARLTGLGEKESRVRHRDVREAQVGEAWIVLVEIALEAQRHVFVLELV